jgi:hypothetical protein
MRMTFEACGAAASARKSGVDDAYERWAGVVGEVFGELFGKR